MSRRVVITGLGLVSPLGNSPEKLWNALSTGRSGIAQLESIPIDYLPTRFGGEAREFTGSIEDFGPLEKMMGRNIKKNLKVMCREIQMGVAVAQFDNSLLAEAVASFGHHATSGAAASRCRILFIASRMRVLMVPIGSCSRLAKSEWLKPS